MDSEWFLKRRDGKNHPFSAEKQEKTEEEKKKQEKAALKAAQENPEGEPEQ